MRNELEQFSYQSIVLCFRESNWVVNSLNQIDNFLDFLFARFSHLRY